MSEDMRKYVLYALGEILLVVLGILIALQINNWNENRKQRAEEIRLLSSIQVDLKQDIDQLRNIIEQGTLRQAQADTILQLMYESKKPSVEQFIRLNRASIAFENHFVVNSGTFDESQSAGSIKFIQNENIRQEIFTYYRNTKRAYTDENTVKQIYEEVFPVFFRKVVATRSGITIWKDLETDLPEIKVDELSKDPDYIAMMVTKVAAEMFQIQDWQDFLEQARGLNQAIQSELDTLE